MTELWQGQDVMFKGKLLAFMSMSEYQYFHKWSHAVHVKTIAGAEDYLQMNSCYAKCKHFYISCFISLCLPLPLYFPILSCVFCCPDDLGAKLFLWAREDTHCSHQNDLDKEPFLPSSWQQLPWKDAHMPKHFSLVQRSWLTHKPVGLKPP